MAEKITYSEREQNYFRRIDDQRILIDSYVLGLQKKAVDIGERLMEDLDDLSRNFIHLKSSLLSLEKEKIIFERDYKNNKFESIVRDKSERVDIEMREIQKELNHEMDCAIFLHWDQRMMDQLDHIGEIRKPSYPRKPIVHQPPSPKPRINIYKQITKPKFSSYNRGSGDGMLSSPSGIAVNESYIYVCDTANDRIQIYDFNASFVFSIQHNKLSHPISICVDSDFVFVTQTQPEKVIKFNVSGKYCGHYSHVRHPTGICIHNREIYVCSSESKHIFLLDYELRPVQRDGVLCEGYLTCPRDVKVSTNELIVLDWGEHLFMFFTLSGSLLKKWCADPKLNIRVPGFFDIDTRNNVILVSDESANNIVVFNFEGSWIHTIGDSKALRKPSGIAILRNARNVSIIVANQRENDQLQIWH